MSLTTLLVTAAASAAAAVIVHALWEPGTIPAAAATPVLLSLFSELLRRPTEYLSEAARQRLGARTQSTKLAESPAGRRWWRHPRWGRAVATGIAGFAIGATALTVGELVFDRSVSDSGEGTTILGGTRSSEPPPAPTKDGEETGPRKDAERASPPRETDRRPGSHDADPPGRPPTETPEATTPGQRGIPTATPTPGPTPEAPSTEARPALPTATP
jgi:hypothetical protein